MRTALKGYHAFLPKPWLKWCIYVVYPLLMLGLAYGLGSWISVIPICGAFVVVAEFMLDAFVFRGIATKQTNRLDYLKTSAKGMPLLWKVLWADGLRRFLSIAVVVLGSYGTSWLRGTNFPSVEQGKEIFAYTVMVWGCVELGLVCMRHCMNQYAHLLVVYGMDILVILLGFLLGKWQVRLWQLLLLAVAAFGIAYFARKRIMKKARDSYYDESMEKMLPANKIRL